MVSAKTRAKWPSVLESMGIKNMDYYWEKPFQGSIQDIYGLYWKYPYGEGSGAKRKAIMTANPSLKSEIRQEVNLRHLITSSVRTEQRKAKVAQMKSDPYYKAIYGESGQSTSPYYLYGDTESAGDIYAAAQHRYRPTLSPSDISQLRQGQIEQAGTTSKITPEQKQYIDSKQAAQQIRYNAAQRRHLARQRRG